VRSVLAALLVLALAGCDSQGISPVGDAGTDDGPLAGDADGDGITDEDEGRAEGVDTDGDTLPDYRDTDSDNDIISDQIEAGDSDITTPPIDSDGDGTPDFRDLDSDGNGILDEDEGSLDSNGDGTRDFADDDNDGDLTDDVEEIGGTPSAPRDTDGDGIPDYMDLDSDGDTISDLHEHDGDTDFDRIPDRLDLDSDGDGIPDAEEAGDADLGTRPRDTDGDLLPDFRDRDSDDDGLRDEWELENGLDPYSDDTDGDGIHDLVEVEAGSDPLDSTDSPQDRGDLVFVMEYDSWDPPDPDPVMDHIVFSHMSGATTSLTVELVDDPADRTDAPGEFVDRVEAASTSGVEDPLHPGRLCAGGLEHVDREAPIDGVPDTYLSVPVDTTVCFDVHVMPNNTVAFQHEPRLHRCWANIRGDGEVLDTRTIWFLVPPGSDWEP